MMLQFRTLGGQLFPAAKYGDYAGANRALQREPGLVDERDPETSWTALMYALAHGHAEVAGLLLEKGARSDLESKRPYRKFVPGSQVLDHREAFGEGLGEPRRVAEGLGESTFTFHRGCAKHKCMPQAAQNTAIDFDILPRHKKKTTELLNARPRELP